MINYKSYHFTLLLMTSLCLTFGACDDGSDINTSNDQAGAQAGTQAGAQAGTQAGTQAGVQAGTQAGTMMLPTSCEPLVPIDARSIFVERTEEWGLTGVMGTLLSVADLDGDHRPDLVVRRGGVRADVLSGEEIKRHTWIMMNRSSNNELRFEDHTIESGFLTTRGTYPLDVGRPNWVVIFGDIDNDGDLDAYSGIDLRNPPEINLTSPAFMVDQESSEILLNDGTGRFELTYAQDPIRRQAGDDVPSGAAFTDVNRDGWLDLWMSQGGLGAPLQDRLFVNRGQGNLNDRTLDFGLGTQEWESLASLNNGEGHSTAWSAGACDLNLDGIPELFVGSYGRAPNHLWLGSEENGQVTYENHSVASGFAFDDNQDWTGDQFARCFCASNSNAPECADVPPPLISCGQQNWNHDVGRSPFRLGGNTGAILCEDLDGDGDLDMMTAEIRHWWAGEGSDASEIMLNDGAIRPTFTRPGREALGMTIEHGQTWDEGHISATVLDYDNDGYQDLFLGATDYPGNQALIFHNETGLNNGTPLFRQLSDEEGLEHHRSHGVAVGDFDGDGDLDLILGHSRMRCGDDMETPCYPQMQVRAFENIVGQSKYSVQLTLKGGDHSGGLVNADAVGALVEVNPLNVENEHKRVRYVRGGYGHFGQQNQASLTIGLNEACTAEVTVTWPNAARSQDTFTVQAGQRYLVKPGEQSVMSPAE